MSKLDQLDEPSMEEILASIRRAIDEDSRFATESGNGVAQRGARAGSRIISDDRRTPSDQVIKLAEDVLEISRAARDHDHRAPLRRVTSPEEPSVLRPSFGQRGEPAPAISTPSGEDTVPGREMNREAEDQVAAETVVPETASGVADMRRDRDLDGPIAGSEILMVERSRETPRPVKAAASDMPLVAADIDRLVGAAFEKLTDQLAEVRAKSNVTLEDVVKDLMRPAIKDWLDNNLSDVVERMVQAEIERLIRRGA